MIICVSTGKANEATHELIHKSTGSSCYKTGAKGIILREGDSFGRGVYWDDAGGSEKVPKSGLQYSLTVTSATITSNLLATAMAISSEQ